ncbi:MAG: hypothetical protein M3Q39_14080 [Actinomycetota bacterium]|nr:hypothetical protein [Actinomycetota bacterium]
MVSTGTAGSGGRRLRYVDVRPYALPDELAELAGPTGGEVSLPRALAWGPRRSFILEDPDQRRMLYEIVVQEASTATELGEYLSRALLTDLWPRLTLPPRCRQQWEARFPELARRAVA